jgi:flagellar biosynthesis protein
MSDTPDSIPRAVALEYDGKNAPRVTAKGQGELAQQIIDAAREHGIPLHEDRDLLTLLAKLELGDEIPRALYVTVAHVIAWTYYVKGKVPER